jgi:hypothetical protein
MNGVLRLIMYELLLIGLLTKLRSHLYCRRISGWGLISKPEFLQTSAKRFQIARTLISAYLFPREKTSSLGNCFGIGRLKRFIYPRQPPESLGH